MKIETIKDLKKLIDLCRKSGVKDIVIEGISLTLGDEPRKPIKAKSTTKTRQVLGPSGLINVPEDLLPPEVIETPDELTEEQLMFYSAGVPPEGAN